MKRLLYIWCILVMLTGCTTIRFIQPTLPDVSFATPERPALLEVDSEVPEEVTINLIRMTAYAEKLELAVSAWETYYNSLKEKNDGMDYDRN